MYNFQPKAESFGGVVGTDITDLRVSASMVEYSPGDCIELRVQTLSPLDKPLMVRDTTAFTLKGFRSSDIFYRNSACSATTIPDDLKIESGKSERTLYLKSGSPGNFSLEVVFGGVVKRSLSLFVRAMPRALSLQMAPGSVTLPAGYCSGPFTLQLLDNFAMPVPSGRYQVQLTSGRNTVFSDNVCNSPVASQTVQIANDNKFTFYLRSNQISRSLEKLAFGSTDPRTSGDERMLYFESVPYLLQIVGGPSNDVVPLGRCEASPFVVRMLDVEGNLVAPKAPNSINVALQFATGSGLFQTSCSNGSPITELQFNASESAKSFFLVSQTRSSFSIAATSLPSVPARPLIPASRVLNVAVVPIRITTNTLPSVTAGAIAGPLTVTLRDGLDEPMPAPPGGTAVSLSGTFPGIASFCNDSLCNSTFTDSLTIPAGAQTRNFWVRPGANLETRSDRLVLTPGDASIAGTEILIETLRRLPAKLAILDGVSSVALNECAPVPFRVALLDSRDQPVTVPPSATLEVNLGFESGTGTYLSNCNGTTITRLEFGAGTHSLPFSFRAGSRGTIVLRVTDSAGVVALATRTLTVNVTPKALSLVSPGVVTAGVPSNAIRVQVQDALGGVINVPAAITVNLTQDALARGRFCLVAACPMTTTPINSVTISAGSSGTDFYYLSDADGDLNPQIGASTSSLGLTAASISLTVRRTSLVADPRFTFSTPSFLPLSGGEALAATFLSNRFVVGGYQLSNGKKRIALARYLWDPSSPSAIGVLDSNFGRDGTQVLVVGEESWVAALGVGPSGKTLVVAVTRNPDSALGEPGDHDIVLLQLNADGSLDSAFRPNGAGGVLPLVLPGDQFATSIAVAGDGYIFVGGYGVPDAPTSDNISDALLAAFTPTGISANVFKYDLDSKSEVINVVKVQNHNSEERILIGGNVFTGSGGNSDFAVARVHGRKIGAGPAPGDLDASFGTGGIVSVDLGGLQGDELRDLTVLSGGQIVVAGYRKMGGVNSEIALAGFTSSGVLDSSFGVGGKAIINLSGNQEKVFSIASNPRTDEIYVGGHNESGAVVVRMGGTGTNALSVITPSAATMMRSLLLEPLTFKPVLMGNSGGNFKGMRYLR
jgi:uncharacterized delta-60 repeat protein